MYASPNESDNFFNDINQINGDGYPDQSQNLGVSFGMHSSNPYPGQRWTRFEIRTYLGVLWESEDFNVTSEVAVPGSYLPLDVTNVWAYGCDYPAACGTGELLRYPPVHPAFIPTASALHETGGQSRFDETMTAAAPSFHDTMPTELANRLLDWLNYPPLPLSVSISGPTSLLSGQTGVWSANVSGGTPPYSYQWQYRYNDGGGCPSCPEKPWVGWNGGGTGPGMSATLYAAGGYTIKVTVTDAAATSRTATKGVTVTNGARVAGTVRAGAVLESVYEVGASRRTSSRIIATWMNPTTLSARRSKSRQRRRHL